MDHNDAENCSQNHVNFTGPKPSKCLKNLTFSRQGEKVTLGLQLANFFAMFLQTLRLGRFLDRTSDRPPDVNLHHAMLKPLLCFLFLKRALGLYRRQKARYSEAPSD